MLLIVLSARLQDHEEPPLSPTNHGEMPREGIQGPVEMVGRQVPSLRTPHTGAVADPHHGFAAPVSPGGKER